MILACHNLSKSFGDQVIVKDGSFHIENHEKAALVGLNGAGKSTILKMIVGQLSPDAGTVVLTKGKTLGYLAQHQEMEIPFMKKSARQKPKSLRWKSRSVQSR